MYNIDKIFCSKTCSKLSDNSGEEISSTQDIVSNDTNSGAGSIHFSLFKPISRNM